MDCFAYGSAANERMQVCRQEPGFSRAKRREIKTLDCSHESDCQSSGYFFAAGFLAAVAFLAGAFFAAGLAAALALITA